MKRISVIIAATVLSVFWGASSVSASGRKALPVALCGDPAEIRAFQMDVTTSERIRVERYPNDLPAADALQGFAAVVAGECARDFGKAASADWLSAAYKAALESYVRSGGTVFLLGRLGGQLVEKDAEWRRFLGVERFGNGANTAVRVTAGGKPWLWADGLSQYAQTYAREAIVLSEAEFANGSRYPVALKHQLGAGSFIWLSLSYARYDQQFAAKKKVIGEADEKGLFVLTPDGESMTAVNRFAKDLLLALPMIDTSAPPSQWGTQPLGEPGDLKLTKTLANQPTFRPLPVRRAGLRFWSAEEKGVVVAPRSDRKLKTLAKELARHLSQMVGEEVPVVSDIQIQAATPAIVIGDATLSAPFGVEAEKLALGEAILKRQGNRLLVYGRGSGQNYALTYLLEALGCRYLWPGKTGKVIPKKTEIIVPELDFDYVPAYKIREMRDFKIAYRHSANKLSLKDFWGIDPETFGPVFEASLKDDPENRDFWTWHGVNDTRDIEGNYRWGHYFGDYYAKYAKDHPDWFALQANGSRDQDLGNRPERPCLCVSNRGLIEQAARDAIEAFRSNPNLASFSLCLPDGGYPSQCMCEDCRRLDPTNAAKISFHIGSPWWRNVPYVALSDRMMAFNNAVAELVAKEFPEKKLGAYIYSFYEEPPVRVKPHPNLVLLSVAGSLGSTGKHGDAVSNIAAWSQVTKNLLWRPNTLFQFAVSAPQNYARQMFNEIELFKVNHVIGTDFDCVNGQFATKGLIFYTMAVALRNPDSLDYDTVVADYCQTGFGAAADVIQRYFTELERMTDAGIAAEQGNNGFLARLDVARLAEILDQAESAAAGDKDVLARLAYLRLGVDAGRIEKKLGAAWDAKDRAGVMAAQEELRAFMAKAAFIEPAAVNPIWVSGTYHSPNMRQPNF